MKAFICFLSSQKALLTVKNSSNIKHSYFLINKPYGYLSQFINNQNKRKGKRLLGELYHFPENSMAVGRLDQDSEGLLLITTDGKFSQHIRSSHVEKAYWVQVDGLITEEAIEQLKKGVHIKIEGHSYVTKECKVQLITEPESLPHRSKAIRDERHGPTSWLSITLREGKFRQVRKMTAAVGFPTLRLIRCRIGHLNLELLKGEQLISLNALQLSDLK